MLEVLDSPLHIKYGAFKNFDFTQLWIHLINVFSREFLNTCIG